MTTFRHIIEDTANFAGSYFYWNTVLNESGISSWNWRQNSLVTVDRRTDAVRFNPEFFSMKHFSATVMPGARRIAVSGGPFKNVVAFLNPTGTRVIVFANDSEKAVPAEIDTGCSRVKIEALAKSMNTVIIPAN
jgi:glucosylceramidase